MCLNCQQLTDHFKSNLNDFHMPYGGHMPDSVLIIYLL